MPEDFNPTTINQEVTTPNGAETLVKDDFDDYSTAKLRIDRLIADFQPEYHRTNENRDHRFKDLNIQELKDKGILKNNQFMIPMRIIDSNIRREQPAFVNFIRQSRRLLTFKSIKNPQFVPNKIEDEFTRGNQYSGWEQPHFKVIDGSQTHGWDFVEVVLDTTKPLHVAVEHVGHDRLIFPLDAQDIQTCELILRKYSVTPKQLKQYVRDFGFIAEEVASLIDKNAETKKESSICIYKCFWKRENIVWVAWYAETASTWLKEPAKLYVGREVNQQVPNNIIDPLSGLPVQSMEDNWVDVDEVTYPIFMLPYYETEQARIADHKGRVFLDKHKQEALTANISQFLNGCQNASTILTSLKTEALRQAELQSIVIGADKIPLVPLEFTAMPYPDSIMLQLQQYLDVYNSQEVGQVSFAAQNRKDSRKTATEVAAAQQENAQLSSVQVVLYSTFVRELYSYVWEIVKSRAIQNKITFLVDPMTGTNDIESIDQPFDLKSAGDIDVVKRQEQLQQYKEFWPVVMNTPLAMPFLSRMLRLSFPDEGDVFARILEAGDPRALIVALAQILEDVVDPQEMAALPPEQKQVLINVLEQAKLLGEQFMAQAGSPGQNQNMGQEGETNGQLGEASNS